MTAPASESTEVTRSDLVTVTIDGIQVDVPAGTLVIRAAEQVGVQIPRFCDHPLLDPVGACRQCLVEIPDAGNGRGMPKPQASCTIAVADGMVVNTQATSQVAKKAQEGIMEFLLINHPLDCPICDKGGECPLQNQSMSNGTAETRYPQSGGVKRVYPKPINISAQILLDRERCILCARCTRFSEQIAGDPFIEMIERGALQQVGIYEKEPYLSYFSGNTIQICPVGALTSVDYRFRSRPFDLVSTPSVSELDACGSAIRVDHRRGRVMRRLSGDDPEVNEEWITDKDRFAFNYAVQPDRLTHPMVREDGELRPASWTEAFVVAARGLAGRRAGVLTGGRLTVEDAYAYSRFARAVLGTNDIDFRARPHSAEEADFLASVVALSDEVGFADLETARAVLLVGLEPEDEAGTVFLRLRKAHRKHGTPIWSVASHTTPGLRKMGGTLLPAVPGREAEVVDRLAHHADVPVDSGTVVLVGERMATAPGALSAVARLARSTGARLAWVPRRAGDRGAVEAGALPNLLPGGRPVSESAARAETASAWGTAQLPDRPGRDTAGIVAAAIAGELDALVVGGVDTADLPDPDAAERALAAAGFVVSLELRESAVTAVADVVFPVAAAAEKSGTFLNWEGRARRFDQVFEQAGRLPDLRVLAGIAEEMEAPMGFRTVEQVRAQLDTLAPWSGGRPEAPTVPAGDGGGARDDGRGDGRGVRLVLSSWKQLIDDGRMQDGAGEMRATARRPMVLVGPQTLARLGVAEGETVTVTGPLGSTTLPIGVADLAEGTAWAPASAPGQSVRHLVGPAGCTVTLEGGPR